MKNKIISLSLIFVLMTTVISIFGTTVFAQTNENKTYDNLYASVQGETNAAAAYQAFADKAEKEGYPIIANLFRATAEAETKHANDEWNILQNMGATERPTAATPTVGSTEQNLQTAFDGETYEYTVMYPEFLATAQKEGNTEAERIFRRAMSAEEVHANNYQDVLENLQDENYVNEKYSEVYRCVVCGEVVPELPDRCPICGALGDTFVEYTANEKNIFSNSGLIALIAAIAIIAAIAVVIVVIKKRNK